MSVFILACPYQQPISMNAIIPMHCHPIKSWNRLLAVVKMTIVIKIVNRYLMHRCRFGSECMSHLENSEVGHVTYEDTGKKTFEKKFKY